MEQPGIYLIKKDHKNILMFNGQEISAVKESDDSTLGVYVLNKTLTVDGIPVAASVGTPNPVVRDNVPYLSEVNLSKSGECINITQSDYNKLFKGIAVGGYKRYNVKAIYNIVSDVSSAPIITYTIANGVITFSDSTTAKAGNNIVYNSTSGLLTENTIDAEATILSAKCPFVNVRYFNPIIPVNGTLDITYYVDTQDMDSLRYGTRTDTFTVIVKDADGTVLGKNTTYAGDFTITTPAFTTEGETWISIECIDSNGVGSAVQFFDIWVKASETISYYEMQEKDLEAYGIVVDDDSLESAYSNKAALSNFFADVKSGEIDDSNGYDGVVMLDYTYYIDYHARCSESSILGTQVYKRAKVNLGTKKVTSIAAETISEDDVLASGVTRAFKTSDSTFNLVGSSFADSNDKMSEWEEYGYFHKIGGDYYIYYVYNTSKFEGPDAYIVFPNNFTIDLNGATIKAIPTTDIRGGCTIRLDGNVDTHIKNGNLVGNYKEFNFRLGCIREGVARPAEWQSNFFTYNSRYCSFENLNLSYPMGYDGSAGGSLYTAATSFKAMITPENNYTRVNIADKNGSIIDSSQESNSEFITTSFVNIADDKEVRLGCWGYGGNKFGKRREVFYSFYDNQDEYITTIKSKSYWPCKVPSGAAKVKVTGYGLYDKFASESHLELWHGGIAMSRNIAIKDCDWYETRTCAMASNVVRGLLVDNCSFTNCVSCENRYKFHNFVVDFEDGWQNMSNVQISNCTLNKGTGSDHFLVYCCEGFNFINNTGWRFLNNGGIESGWLEGNTFTRVSNTINYLSPHPSVVIRDNEMDELTINYNNDTEGVVNEYRLLPEMEMENTTIKTKCNYIGLRLRNSMNGDVWND